jgi:hypothetical protein
VAILIDTAVDLFDSKRGPIKKRATAILKAHQGTSEFTAKVETLDAEKQRMI